MAKVLVYNTKTKDQRYMGEDQFKDWGSKNDFKLVPEGSKGEKVNTDETGNSESATKEVKVPNTDETGTDETGKSDNTVKKLTSVADIVTEIERISKDEELSDEVKIEKINTFKNGETRGGILKAIVKYGQPKNENDA